AHAPPPAGRPCGRARPASAPPAARTQAGLACALGVLGLGLAIGSRYGRAGAGTVVAAVVTAALLAGAAALPRSVTADWSRVHWRPASAADVRPAYELGSGVGTLDLTGLGLRPDQTVATRLTVGAGRAEVRVPADATVRLTAEVGYGDVRLPGERADDVDLAPDVRSRVTLPPEAGRPARGTIEIDLEAGVGQVEVRRERS
ncbi:hypothetical protein ACSNOD_31425, partial [Streptomyces sp. URMC 123]